MFFTSEQFNALPEWYKPILENAYRQSQALSQQQYPRYEEPRVAEARPLTLKSYEMAQQMGNYQPYIDRAASTVSNLIQEHFKNNYGLI